MSCEKSIAEMKSELRSRIRRARRELDEAERRFAAEAVAQRIASLQELENAKLVLAYMPMKYELDILPAAELLKERGVSVAFPLCIDEGGLRLFVPANENGFVTGAYGILEPDINTAREVTADMLDAILLPAIGFDRHGNRLGQGGGYYDRLLAKTDCLTVAVGFDCQLVDEVPTEPNDRKVDIIASPCELLRL